MKSKILLIFGIAVILCLGACESEYVHTDSDEVEYLAIDNQMNLPQENEGRDII